MNISRENLDDLNAVLKVHVEKADYEENVEKVLRDYRKKASVKGFRPGMVPMGLIRKMYGKAVQLDEMNKVVSESISKYLKDENLDILGDPMPKADENSLSDLETREDFTFSFELGLAPVFDIRLNKKNRVINYSIIVDEKMKNDYLQNYTRRYGTFIKAGKSEEKDILKGRIEAVDAAGNPLPEGLSVEESTLSVELIDDKKIKKMFTGRSENDVISFDLRKAFPNNNEIAGLLKIKREEAESVNGIYSFTISEISRFAPAEIGQELFDRIYGPGVVSSEEEFMTKIEEEISHNLKHETEFRLASDLKKLAVEKCGFELPEEFLKKWLLSINEKSTEEQISSEFDKFREDLKWQLIRNKAARQNDVKITEEELLHEAEKITRYQFMQYGLYYATDEQVNNYAREMLKREDEAKRMADRILDEKVIGILKDMVKIDEKKVKADEFNKLSQ